MKLWNYQAPAATEKRFRDLLPLARSSNDRGYRAELLTQIARARGLQNRFDDAHQTLDQVERMLDNSIPRARIRYLLERGRVFNSSNHSAQALHCFHQANDLATETRELSLQIDAMHMIAIAETDPHVQLKWNLEAIDLTLRNPTESRWLYALYNNTGETYLLLKDYPSALEMFQNLANLDRKQGKQSDIFAMKDIGKCLRLCGRLEESARLLSPLVNQNNPWIDMELGETLLAQHKPTEAKPHLKRAYEALSKEKFTDPKLLDHLKQLLGTASHQP